MRAFLSSHRRELRRERTVILNLDEVGAGTVRYTRREGPLLATRSHLQLVKLCDEIAEDDDADHGPRPREPRGQRRLRRALGGLPAITITCRDDHGLGRRGTTAAATCPSTIERLDARGGRGVLRGADRAPRRARGPELSG